MNLNGLKLKDINSIDFNIHLLDYISGSTDDFIIQEANIIKVVMERNRLKIIVSDDVNKAQFYIKAKDIQGENIIKDLFLSDRMIDLPLLSFPNLELKYFKK